MIMEAFLDPKTQLLVAIAAAVAAKCQNCFVTLYGAADKVGATDKEVQAAVAIATKVTAKSHDFMAAFIEQTTKGTVRTSANEAATTGCSCT
jgi:AhpD family alkylhydroperoxidase